MRRVLLLVCLLGVRQTQPYSAPIAAPDVCRSTVHVGAAPVPQDGAAPDSTIDVMWRGPSAAEYRRTLAAWCAGVGPAVLVEGVHSAAPTSQVIVASWNMHVGGGDLAALLSALNVLTASGEHNAPFVLLLQEVFRRGSAVPALVSGARSAGRITQHPPRGERKDIVAYARDLGLWAAYVPSMRNGADVPEDRGNAILSNLPLEDIEAIELPGGRQRRVAVTAVVSGRTQTNDSWRLRVASVHLENRTDARRLWIFAGGVRAAQARAAVDALTGSQSVVLGGDFNSWSGFDETAYRETVRLFPETLLTDRRPTFGWGRRLDHLFFRLPSGWRASFARLDERFGSDHYPLAGEIDLTSRAIEVPAGASN